MNSLIDRVMAHFERHKEQAFIVKAFLLLALIFWIEEYLYSFLIIILFLMMPLFFFSWAFAWSVYTGRGVMEIIKDNITLLPGLYSDEKNESAPIPYVTFALVLLNVAVFYLIQRNPVNGVYFKEDNFIFLPRHPNLWNVPVSLFTAMFLHGSAAHLWGNMFFLWGIGSEVEKRTGSRQFLPIYIMTGVAASIVFALVEFIFNGEIAHGLGASGAISGMMGIFAVRCYFKTVVFPIPVLGVLPINLKIRMNSLSVMGLFFIMDLQGGIESIKGTSYSGVGHWAHIGGMVAGMIIAWSRNFGDAAIEERHVEIGLKRLNEGAGLGEGEESLKTALQKNQNNIEAVLALARMKSNRSGTSFNLTEEGAECYQKAIRLLISKNPKEAAEVYNEYYAKYMKGVEPNLQCRIAGVLYNMGQKDQSGRALELLAESNDTPPDIREKAMYKAAVIMEELGLSESAQRYYRQFIEIYPDSEMSDRVRGKICSK